MDNDDGVCKNIAFFLSYSAKIRYIELAFVLDMCNPREYSIMTLLLSNLYEIISMNYGFIFHSFPKDFMAVWTYQPKIISEIEVTDKQRDLFADFLLLQCKIDYYKAISNLFLLFNITGIFKKREGVDFEKIYEKRFRHFVKGSKFIKYTDFVKLTEETANKDPSEIIKQTKLSLMGSTKNLKKIKESGFFNENQISRIEGFYKKIIKNTLICMKLSKNKINSLKAVVSVNKDLSFDIDLVNN